VVSRIAGITRYLAFLSECYGTEKTARKPPEKRRPERDEMEVECKHASYVFFACKLYDTAAA
jgi:hypothetical protein